MRIEKKGCNKACGNRRLVPHAAAAWTAQPGFHRPSAALHGHLRACDPSPSLRCHACAPVPVPHRSEVWIRSKFGLSWILCKPVSPKTAGHRAGHTSAGQFKDGAQNGSAPTLYQSARLDRTPSQCLVNESAALVGRILQQQQQPELPLLCSPMSCPRLVKKNGGVLLSLQCRYNTMSALIRLL
jgi:hypothetical protein